jgi:hypothetical protein
MPNQEISLDEFLENYIRYMSVVDLRDKAMVKQLLDKVSIDLLVDHINAILKNKEKEKITNSLCFIRDLYLSPGFNLKQKKILMNALEKHGFFKILDRMLYSKIYRHRSDSIYTFGKLSNPKFHHNLVSALNKFYLKKDPHLVSHLVFEINWLNRKSRNKILSTLANHKNYLFRWAALGLDNCYDFKNSKVRRILSGLQNDPVKVIRSQYQEKVSNGVDVPKLDYSSTEVFIGNFLTINKYDSYSIGFLKRVFNFYIKNNDAFLSAIENAQGSSEGISKVYKKIDRVIKRNGTVLNTKTPTKKKL